MHSTSKVIQYVVAVIAFTLLDLVWLSVVANKLYDDLMGDLLAQDPNLGAAVAFYALFLAGLVHFVIHPAVVEDSWRQALGAGAFFGLVTYATWDLTNLAVVEGFPALLVPIDLTWGALLSAAVSVTTWAIVRRLPRSEHRH